MMRLRTNAFVIEPDASGSCHMNALLTLAFVFHE